MLKIVERARKAVSTGDFSVLKANLTVLNEYLDENKLSINPVDKDEIDKTIKLINFAVSEEKNRRKEISNSSEKYEQSNQKLVKCNELFELYSHVLNKPMAKTYTFSSSPKNVEEELLKDFFEAIQKELGLSVTPNTINEIKDKMTGIEKDIDSLAFKINKLNGVYDEKVANQDLARAKELANEEKVINDARKTRIKLRKDLKNKVPSNEYKKYIGKNNSKEIDTKIDSLKKIPQNRRTPQEKDLLKLLEQLKPLSTIKKLDVDKKAELDSLYAKYGVISIEEMQSVLSKNEVENSNTPTKNNSRLITSDLVEEANASHVNAKEGVRILRQLDTTDLGKDLDEVTINLRQNGYMPYVGKESAIYARPIYKRNIFGKTTFKGMELVEESIESLADYPEKAYKKALKDLQKRSKMLKYGPIITNTQIKDMQKAFESLIKDSRYDEAIKRILAVQTSMTRNDIKNLKTQHTETYLANR